MNTDATPAPTADNKPSEPTAASVDQISAACPGATDAFIVAQLKTKATVDQAKDAWMKHLAESNTTLAKENGELKAKEAAPKETVKKPGVEPLSAGKDAAPKSYDDPIAAWDAALQEKMTAGKSKADATRAIVAEQPELHQAYIAAYTAQYSDRVQRPRKS